MNMEVIASPTDKVAKDNANMTRKRGSFHFMRSVLSLINGRASPNKPASFDVVKTAHKEGQWRSLVGAVRPLHQLPQYCPSPPPSSSPSLDVDLFHDVPLPPPSPPFWCDEDGCMSSYASADDLRELERQEGGGDNDADSGNDAIDVKADEFIARFYEQMKLPRLDCIRHHNSIVEWPK